jgi:Protein of unknown function (DUF4012)
VSQIVPKPVALPDREFRRRSKRSGRHRRRRARRRIWIGLLIVIGAVVVVTALAVIPGLRAREHLEQGRDGLANAQAALQKGDLPRAIDEFDRARTEFVGAKSAGDNLLIRIPALIPLVGRTPDAIRTFSDVGLRVAGAGVELTHELDALPGGIDALAPDDRRIPVENLQRLSPVMARVRGEFEQAAAEAEGIATTLVPQDVVDGGDLLREKLTQALPAVRSADEMLRALPTFAGIDAPRHYLLGPENSAELRATGGLLTTFSVVTIDDGLITLVPFRDINEIPVLEPQDAPWPSPDLEDIYTSYNSAGAARNATATLDGPTASLFLENLWNETKPNPIDGVILVDVQALGYLVDATGPLEVAGVPGDLTKRNVVSFVANEAYGLIQDQDVRKDFVGAVGGAVFEAFLKHAGGDRGLRAVVKAAADGHILVNTVDPQVEAAFRSAGISGALGPQGGGDYLAVAVNNTAANKLDYYMERHVGYDVTLGEDRTASAVTTVAFRNEAPADAEPGYVFGPYEGKQLKGLHLQAGEAYQQTSLYCGAACTLADATHDGEPFAVQAYREGHYPLFVGLQRIPAQSSYEVRYDLRQTDAWTGTTGLGTYRLTVRSQPTLNPTTATITIHAPEGTSIAYASSPLEVHGGVATWSGELSDVTTFEIRFQKGLVGRIWSGLDDFLSKPVIRL